MKADDRDREEVRRERLVARPQFRPQRPFKPLPTHTPVTPPPKVHISIPLDGLSLQQDWAWCKKCQGLFYGPNVSSSRCPVGGTHTPPPESQSGNYSLPYNAAPDPSRQSGWRWCNKCQGLFYGPGATSSLCPAGSTHAPPAESGSWDYCLLHNVPPDSSRQSDWRWCNKCQGLFYGRHVEPSRCMAGGTHAPAAASGSGDYSLLARPFDPRVTTPPPPPPPRVLPSSRDLNDSVALRFDPVTHPYIFSENAGTQGGAEIERIVLPYPPDNPNRRLHSYFRDQTKPNRFYFLPDSFKLARTRTAPFVPAMMIRPVQGENPDKKDHIEIFAELRPDLDGARLLAAKAALRAHIPVSSATTNNEPELESLIAHAKVELGVLRSGLVQTVETDSVVDLGNGFSIHEYVAQKDFQQIFAALKATRDVPLFRGQVVVSTDLSAPDLIPVIIRFADMEGEVFQYEEQTDSATGTVRVVLRNATESPFGIEALPVWLRRAGVQVQGRIDGLDLSTPVVLQPNASIDITIHPSQPLPGEGTIDAIFDISQVHGLPDNKKIYDYIVDESVLPAGSRTITVEGVSTAFAEGKPPDERVTLIGLEFQNNVTVTLDASNLKKQVSVPTSLYEQLFPSTPPKTTPYWYRQTILYESGRRSADTEWRQESSAFLWVPAGDT